jgi:hypothetical protein
MERKYYLLEILIVPVVVALVGILGTFFINTQLENSAKARADADREIAEKRAKADQHIKILEIFAEKVSSNSESQRTLALRLLSALDAELEEKIAKAVYNSESKQSILKNVASQVAEDANARARDLPRIYIQIRKEENQSAARSIMEKLKTAHFVVPSIELVDNGPPASELRYFRQEDKPGAESIVNQLSGYGVQVSPKYVPGYENAKTIQPKLYELWFAPGEPKG